MPPHYKCWGHKNRVFDCHLTPNQQQMAIQNTVSIEFDNHSSIVKSIFYCLLSGVRNDKQNVLILRKARRMQKQKILPTISFTDKAKSLKA